MGIVSPKTTADRYLHALTGCIPDLEGDVTLEPANSFLNWRFDDLDEDNNPDGLEIGRPEDPDGFMVYVSARNSGPSTLTAQTTEEIDLDEDSFHIIGNPIDGAAPRSSQFAAQIDQPDAPILAVVPASLQGWAAGSYLVSYTWIDDEDRHTALAPTVRVDVGLGQFIRVFLPTSVADGATHIGIWVTSANGGVDTLRLQAFFSVTLDFPESVLLKGPYTVAHAGVSPPSSNETKSKKPKKPKGKKKKRRGGKGKKGRYRARIRKRNRKNGKKSEASDFSDPVDISQAEADSGVGFGVETEQSGSYDVFVEKDGKESRLSDTKAGRRNSKKPHKKKKKKKRKKKGGKGKKNTHVTGGASVNEGGDLSSDSGDGPADDGVQDPTSPLDSALPEGQIIISPGTYWVALSYSVRGEETMISNPTQVTISSGQTIRVHFPDKNNLLINSQFRDRNADGKPDGWNFWGTGIAEGTLAISPNGMLTLDTFGPRTGTAMSPAIWQYVGVSRSQYYAVGGTVSANLTAGNFVVAMWEYNSSSAVVRATNLIDLPSSATNMPFIRIFGAGFTEFHPETVRVTIYAYFGGSTRHGQGFIHELFVNPNSQTRLRRFNEPRGEGEFVESNPPEFVRWNKSSIVGVGAPPTVGGAGIGAPLAYQDFESSDMLGWGLTQAGATGTTALREGVAAIGGSFGYRISKDTASEAWVYLSRDMGVDRTDLANNFRVRVLRRPTTGAIALGGIKNSASTGSAASDLLAGVYLTYQGALYLGAANRGTLLWYSLATGIVNGDVLDIDISTLDANTSQGRVRISLGKNGARRQELHRTFGWGWAGLHARYAHVGQFSYTAPTGITVDASVQHTLHYDDIVQTDSGNFGVLTSTVPEGFSAPAPDRPFRDPVELDAVDFDTGSIPAPYTAVRSPTDSTTAALVETGAQLEGTHGVRVTDTGTASSATAYVTRSFSPTRTGIGFRSKFRIVALPSTSQIDIMQIRSSGGEILGRFKLDSTGSLWADTLTSTGATHRLTRVYSGLAVGNVLTLEMVTEGVGTEAGTMSYWARRLVTAGANDKFLYAQHQLVPWVGMNISSIRAGICREVVNTVTSSLHVDSIRTTEAGEVLYSESDTQGNEIKQAYFYYPQGTPQRDDLGLKGLETAVQPNETYTVALKARHADVPVQEKSTLPYSLYAYDQNGTEFPLGSLYGEGGAVGTNPWQDLSLTVTIPDGCYVLTMSSPGISSGEFVSQELAISRGTAAQREVTYPQNGQVWAILDTETPEALHPLHPKPLNPWLDIGAVIDLPVGTSADLQFNSADPVYNESGELVATGTEQPTSWFTDPHAVRPRKYLHTLVSMNASSDLRTTPTLATETPFCDFYTRIAAEQVNVLLRDDLSEFSGGVYLSDLPFYRELSQFDVRSPLGQVKRHRMWDPVGDLGAFSINAYTWEAVRTIEENCLSEDFAIETRDYRLTVRFREQVEFDVEQQSVKKVQGVWCCLAVANISGVEVVEILEINKLLDVQVPTQAEMAD